MATPEVQRIWNRFKQMGCDKNGVLPLTALDKDEVGSDVFVQNVNHKSYTQ